MSAILLGIDPGAKGAIAAVSPLGRLEFVEDMPDPLTGATLRHLLDSYLPHWPEKVAVEDVHAMPRQGLSSTFKFGLGHGIVLGALGYAHIPYELVAPSKWKRAMGITADKDTARVRACELWPASAALFARKKDDGRAEAALLAYWLSEREKRGRWAA